MESHIELSFLFVMLVGFVCSSQAYIFHVGGKHGWALKPHENYNHWAERNRFQVNDTLIFKYKKGSNSVLEVNKEDYYKCNKSKPIHELKDGDSKFKLDRSGPFFFISGHAHNCEKGQKLIVLVLALRNNTHKAPSPAPAVPTPSPSPSHVPKTPTPSPVGKPPVSPPPKAEPPRSVAPVPSGNTPGFNAPAPAPSGAPAFGGSVSLMVGLSVVLGSFVGFSV